MGANRFPRLTRILVPLAMALALGACGEDNPVKLAPDADWLPVPNQGVVPGEEAGHVVWDFGTVRLGSKTVALLDVANVGTAPMVVKYPATLAAPFSVDIPAEGLSVAVGETRRVSIAFAPEEEGTYDWSGTFGIAEDESQTFALALKGVGQAPTFTCDTEELSFGKIVKGTSKDLTVNCKNESAVDGVLVINKISGGAVFSHRYTGNEGRVAVPAGTNVPIVVTYQGSTEGPSSGFLLVERELNDKLERVARVRLSGETLDHVIDCTPTTVDFGFVSPQAEAHAVLTCRNEGSDPYRLTSASLDPSSDQRFKWEIEFPVEIPAAQGNDPGEVNLDLVFKPEEMDQGSRKNGILVLFTDDPGNPRLDVPLTGFAGGPVISCSPSTVEFNTVAKGMSAVRSFVCSNTGTDDPTRLDDGLKIAALESTNPAEFTAVLKSGAAPADGYPVGGTFTVEVTYTPIDDGPDSAAIRLPSNAINATDAAPYAVHLKGTGRDLPPCEFSIVPTDLRFGIVEKGRTATLQFAVQNHLPDAVCLIQNLKLAQDCDMEFSLPGGEVLLTEVPPDSELRFDVSFSPTEYRDEGFSCDVTFEISNPDNRFQSVHVTGASQQPCALIAPNDLDFGTVEPGCATRDREFQIINLCSSDLILGPIELAEGASDEFFVRSTPPDGTRVAAGASVSFTMAYRPKDVGEDLGAVFVHVAGTAEPYSAMLHGIGAFGAVQHDKFEQNDRPKVDLLWVIDNSGSMSDEQDEISDNLPAFLSFAQAQNIDYQIGVTSTGIITGGSSCGGGANGGEAGRLFPVDGSHPRILTPNTPNIETHWAFNVKVGTCHYEEEPLEAAYQGLTPPVIDNCDDPRFPLPNDGNCGFLRPEAHLSIIAVTDEGDWSPGNINFYYNAFQSLKGFRNSHLFNFHAITVDAQGGPCTGPDGYGDRLIAMVNKTNGGIFQPICTRDWAASLRQMSASAFGFKTCFNLTSEPDDQNGNGHISDSEGEIELWMNGRLTPSKGLQDQRIWSYDGSQNAVCFEPLTVPEPGTQIEVSYKVACISW